jgi:hypothetical protein
MSFKDTSGTAVIDAVLTDIGRKRMANGTFRPVKFALSDDEIDYALIGPAATSEDGIDIPITGSALFEAYGSSKKNIQHALNTYAAPDTLYMPIIKLNSKVIPATTLSGSSVVYLAANNETEDKLVEILTGSYSIKFLKDRDTIGNKIIFECGLDDIPIEEMMDPLDITEGFEVEINGETVMVEDGAFYTESFMRLPVAIDFPNREKYLVKRNLLDRHFFVMADSRFVQSIFTAAYNCSSFKNFADGSADINFQTCNEGIAITYGNQFEYYNTFLADSIPNMMFDHEMFTYPSTKYSNLAGPKGSVGAINLSIQTKLKVNSTGERDYRYSKFGKIDQTLFGAANDKSYKFDYIETVLYLIGATTDARLKVPVRIIRYSGT